VLSRRRPAWQRPLRFPAAAGAVSARFQAQVSGAGHDELIDGSAQEDHAMAKARICRAAAGAVIAAVAAAGSLSLAATAASAINCPPSAAVTMASSGGGPGC
jgi:hypothetical protein